MMHAAFPKHLQQLTITLLGPPNSQSLSTILRDLLSRHEC
jgi:hypothetical protein